MIYAYIILVAINVVLSFHIFDSWVSFFSTWKMFSPIDLVTLYFKYQRSLDKALRVTSSTVPFISTIYQLLHFSLEVYLKRLPEVTLVCISPTLLFTMKGKGVILAIYSLFLLSFIVCIYDDAYLVE